MQCSAADLGCHCVIVGLSDEKRCSLEFMANSSGIITKQIFKALRQCHTIGSEELFAFGKIFLTFSK